MKLETFFEKFDQFADAPDAVGKMRELVLELAVRGKLVAQDNRDEPASSLLESTASERARLMAARKIKSRPSPPIEPDEQPFYVPSSWAWARLSDVGYELGQKVPDKYFTYIDVGGIDSEKGQISNRVEKLYPADAPSRARKLVARGTVIYSTVRPYLLNIAIVDQEFDPEPIASTAFGILHPFEGVNNRYLFYWLRSAPFTAYVQAGMKGMAYPAINDEKFYSGPIALPPLTEQKRIVAKVDELMALCDRLEAQLQEWEEQASKLARASLARFADAPTPANLQFLFHPSYAISPADLRKSILTLAVQGKLVPQDPNDEPAEELLLAISAEQERLVKARQIRRVDTTPLSEDDEPFAIPSTWVWTRLGKIGDWGSGSTPPRGNHELYGGSIPWLKSGELNDNQALARSEETVTELAVKTCSFRLNNPGDVLLAMYGATIGKAAILSEAAVTNQAVCGCTPFPGFLNTYLFQYLVSQREAFHASSEGGAQPNISKVKIINHPIPLPPLAEQRRIVAKVSELMALVDELETQLTASRAAAEKLLSALVAELTGTTSRLPADS